MKSFKALYIVLIFVATAIIIAVALFVRFGAFRNRTGNNSIKENITMVSGNVTTQSYGIEEFEDIDIKGNVVSFEIVRGNDYSVEYRFPDNIKVNTDVDNGILKINISGTGISMPFFGNRFDSDNYKLTVYVPEGKTFGKFTAKLDAGEIKLDDAVFRSIDVEADAANVELTGVVSDSTRLEADAGNVELRKCEIGDLNVDTEAGNVEIRDSRAGDMEITTEMGNIELERSAFNDGNIRSQMGNVEVNGDFNSLTAQCQLGSLSVDPDNPDKVKLDLDVELGSIRVSGKNIKGRSYNQ